MQNRLAREKSPYLLQHAENPVDWYAWGPEAFEKARAEQKPIFLSIGYSTCHWCHVMERESFEDQGIAEVLNRHFVPVKVDREERPDVDRIYMTFVQATTGSGGWPMSVFLTPDLRPFYGGTYFPPDNRYGRPGFKTLLDRIAEAWQQDRERVVASSADILRQLEEHAAVQPGLSGLDRGALDRCFFTLRRGYDSRHGGFGDAPKFPRPVVFNFLLRTSHPEAREMTLHTLRQMAGGGMYDQLGGGFHRYSVDERWFVPHFEKMLYDQAQLAVSYLEAFQITHDPDFAEVARGIFRYVLSDLRDPEGAFYSAEDADSVIDPAQPKVKGEGAYYIWSQAEIEDAVAQPAAGWLCHRYGVEPRGNVHNDPHHEFTGKNILYQAHTIEGTAAHSDHAAGAVRAGLLQAERALLAARGVRVRPHRDDKILTAWNGLMISALAQGGAILGQPEYSDAARAAAEFVLARLYRDGVLLRRYRDGEAAVAGFLDDYAFFVQALLDLYETRFDQRHLQIAIRLTEEQLERFEDREHGGFFSTAAGDPSLVLRMKEDYDGAEPSGNSIAALNLLRLAAMTGRDEFRQAAERTLRAFAQRLMEGGIGVPQMLVAYGFSLARPMQVVLAGSPESLDTAALLKTLHARFLPYKVVLLADHAPVAGMVPLEGKAAAYVCENFTCRLPTSDPERFAELLDSD